MTRKRKRIGIFGWGVVAPKSPDISVFERNLDLGVSWLEPFEGFGPSGFLVGRPEFDFKVYKPWIDERFEPRKFAQLDSKMGNTVKFAIGAFIQALGQNPGLEQELRRLGNRTHVYVGTGLGDFPLDFEVAKGYERAQRQWNRFWCAEERNPLLARYRAADAGGRGDMCREHDIPEDPAEHAPEEETFEVVLDAWFEFWVRHSDSLHEYLERLREIEAQGIEGDIDSGKGHLIRRKITARRKLKAEVGCPLEPWNAVDPRLLWNLPNIPAAQISMLGRITGPSLAPIAACSGFGTALKLASNAIELGEAKAVVVGMTDPEPHALSVGSFYQARVLSQDGQISKPFTGMRGTHISGGACLWIVGDVDHFTALGMRPLGLEIVSVAINSDADHIITPSMEGPRAVIAEALEAAGAKPEDVATWDMHATATPGDWTELQNALSVFPGTTRFTARKGSFGHGMSVCGGWELTAQHIGFANGILHPIDLEEEELHPQMQPHHESLTGHDNVELRGRVAGKINMGIGGVNACVISRLWDD